MNNILKYAESPSYKKLIHKSVIAYTQDQTLDSIQPLSLCSQHKSEVLTNTEMREHGRANYMGEARSYY